MNNTTATRTTALTIDQAMANLAAGLNVASVVRPAPKGSEVIVALEAAWEAIRANVQATTGVELPPVVIVTGSGVAHGSLTWAHFMPEGWVEHGTQARSHEVFISGERLATGGKLTLQSLLHEATHLVAHLQGVADCSRGSYHNGEFRRLAATMGLEYTHGGADARIGYSAVTLDALAEMYYGEVINGLDRAIRMSQDTYDRLFGALGALVGPGIDPLAAGPAVGAHTLRLPKAKVARRTSGTKVRLTCCCGHVVSTSRRTADAMVLGCRECGEAFTED